MPDSTSGWPVFLRRYWRCLHSLLLASMIAAATGCAARTPAPIISATATPAGPITMFPLPEQDSYPGDMTAGPDGAVWFTMVYMDRMNQIARITANGTISTFPPLSGNNGIGLGELVVGPDGAVWFADGPDNAIGRITTGGAVTLHAVPTARSGPDGLTMGGDGALWFTEAFANRIGRITASGQITEFPLPRADGGPDLVGPDQITFGPDGALWFTEVAANRIGRITTQGAVTEFSVPTAASGLSDIILGPDGALWFAEEAGNQIGRITARGTITEFPLPTTMLGTGPISIAVGPDRALWFTEDGPPSSIGRITEAGTVTDFPLPNPNSIAIDIVAGARGTLWFTDKGGNIGRITTA